MPYCRSLGIELILIDTTRIYNAADDLLTVIAPDDLVTTITYDQPDLVPFTEWQVRADSDC